jgi:hypothetical protein
MVGLILRNAALRRILRSRSMIGFGSKEVQIRLTGKPVEGTSPLKFCISGLSVFGSHIRCHSPKNVNHKNQPVSKKVLITIGSHLADFCTGVNQKWALPNIWGIVPACCKNRDLDESRKKDSRISENGVDISRE